MNRSDAALTAGVVGALGQTAFGPRLDRLVRSCCGFDMSCIFAFSERAQPVTVYDGYSRSVSRDSIANYTIGGYLLDPFYVASISGDYSGVWRMADLAPDCFYSSSFLISPEIHPCVSAEEGSLVEEVGFMIPLGQAITATYSLMRLSGGVPFSDAEMAQLRNIEPLVASLVTAHWQAMRPADQGGESDRDMESAFQLAFKGRLTPTQQRVAKLILRGHSVASIAANLSIAEGTAKLHRSNIYRRLSISSQSELFQIFIENIFSARSRVS
jgi:DNA-binding CsgD family transcriptional regulator